VVSTSSFAPILDAAAHGRLAVFAGAGLSMASPSYLPDWIGFNRLLLETVKTSALELPGISQAAADAISGLSLEDLAVEAFSNPSPQRCTAAQTGRPTARFQLECRPANKPA
jgi:hypothetical protein